MPSPLSCRARAWRTSPMPGTPPISSGPQFSTGSLRSSLARSLGYELSREAREPPFRTVLHTSTRRLPWAVPCRLDEPSRRGEAAAIRAARHWPCSAPRPRRRDRRRRWRRWRRGRRRCGRQRARARRATAPSRSCMAYAWRTPSARSRTCPAPTCRPGSRPRIVRRARCWKATPLHARAVDLPAVANRYPRSWGMRRVGRSLVSWRSTARRSRPGWRSATRSRSRDGR